MNNIEHFVHPEPSRSRQGKGDVELAKTAVNDPARAHLCCGGRMMTPEAEAAPHGTRLQLNDPSWIFYPASIPLSADQSRNAAAASSRQPRWCVTSRMGYHGVIRFLCGVMPRLGAFVARGGQRLPAWRAAAFTLEAVARGRRFLNGIRLFC